MPLDQLRAALAALDSADQLDRHALDRVVTIAMGALYHEIEKAEQQRHQLRLRGMK